MRPSDQSLATNESKESEPRFAFGKNWTSFLARLTDERLDTSRQALIDLLGTSNLRGKRFLDVGCGSGLFSLAAASMGAETLSFDYDSDSVACTTELRRRFAKPEWLWRIERASILDAAYVVSLGDTWDFVYSWGVLHHTGQMTRALANAGSLVSSGGVLAIAIYNDQEQVSRRWTAIKRATSIVLSCVRRSPCTRSLSAGERLSHGTRSALPRSRHGTSTESSGACLRGTT